MKKDIKNILLILLIALIAFWQVLLLKNCLKWDFADITIPWRFFIGESLKNGLLPLWVPYAKLGFPLYFDPQTWYPVSWLIGLTTGYTVFTVQAEYVLHVFLAGVGMYYFISHFNKDKKIRLFGSIIFMLSGFFIGNAQHMGWIVSGTWIPFILYSYLNIFKKQSILPVLTSSLFLFLLLTGGYFPFFITTVYTLIIIFIYKTFLFVKTKEYKHLKICILKHLVFLIIFMLISLVVFLSLAETMEFIGRGKGITLHKALNNPIEPNALLTFIFPFSTMWGNADFWGADKTVINSYFGILPLIILIFGVFIRKNKTERLFILLGIFAYLIAMANIFPIRKILYYTLPFFNYFRFPSLFRYFGIFAFSVFTALILNKILNHNKLLNRFKIVIIIFSVFLLIFIIYSRLNISGINIRFNNWFQYFKLITFSETVVIQGTVHLIILSAVIFILFIKKEISKKITFILIIISFDMLISAQLNAPITVFSKVNAVNLKKNLKKLPEGYPIPENSEKIIDIKKEIKGISPLWRNMGFYYKKIDPGGYGPYQLKNFTKFEQSGLFSNLLNNSLFYFAENFLHESGTLDTTFIENNSEGIVLTDNLNLLNGKLGTKQNCSITILKFRPKQVCIKTSCPKKSFLVFMQNYKNDWQSYIDRKKTKIYPVNYSLQGIIVPEGTHEISFSFENKKITYSFYISSISFLLLVLSIIFITIKNPE